MLKRTLFLLAFAGALSAQQTAAPTPEQVGSPRGDTMGDYTVNQSFETGYRWSLVGGNLGMYRSVDNFGNGIRLLGSSLSVNSKDGHGHYFDEILLNTMGLGNDPYESTMLRIQKNQLYRYDMSWRMQFYYNPGLTVSGGTHLENTSRRLQDHDLTLLPQSKVRFRVGYSRNTESGPALTTLQEFDSNGAGLPVFGDVRRQWNEYRLGADVDVAGFKLTLTRRWDFFKDDTQASSLGAVSTCSVTGNCTDLTVLQQGRRTEPIHGANPGWLGNLFTRRKWVQVNARLTYVSGNRDFALSEVASGLGAFGGAASRQIVVGGNASRPDLAGNFNLALFPTERLSIVNDTSITSNRIDGNSTYSEVQSGFNLGTTVYFRYLGIRTVTNSTDLTYRLRKWLSLYAGYHYSDRVIREVDGSNIPAFANSSTRDAYQVSNHLDSGRAGFRIKPSKPLTIDLNGEIGRANFPLTAIADKHYHSLNGRADYRLRRFQFSSYYRQVYNLNAPFVFSTYNSHSRAYSASGGWTPRDWFSLDAGYSKLHLDTRGGIAFFAGTGIRPTLQSAFPSYYISSIHAANLTARIGIRKRADVYFGYNITKDTGDGRATAVPASVTNPIAALVASVQTFPLTYQSPMVRFSVRLAPKLRWNAGWQFYDYAEDFHILGAAQNYHAHTGYTSVMWAF